jgi:hypothetical protein
MTVARGEVWLFDLGMAEKVRPALVISVAFGDADHARWFPSFRTQPAFADLNLRFQSVSHS